MCIFLYIQDISLSCISLRELVCFHIYKTIWTLLSLPQRMCTPYIQTLYIFIIKDTFFLIQLAQILHVVSYIYIAFPRLYGIFLIYREYPFSLPRLISLYIVFSFRFCPDSLIYKIVCVFYIYRYKTLFSFCTLPQIYSIFTQTIFSYIYIPFSFFLVSPPEFMSVSYIEKTLFFLDCNVLYRENNTFLIQMPFLFFVLPRIYGCLYIYSIDIPFLFQFLPRGISLYIQYLIYCLDFPYIYRNTMYFPIYTILPIQTLFLFYLAQIPHIQCVFHIYIAIIHFSFLLCPDFLYIYRINTSFFLYFAQKCVFLYIAFPIGIFCI